MTMKRPIGIDLGTTHCCLAWTDGDGVVVYQELGRALAPSATSFSA